MTMMFEERMDVDDVGTSSLPSEEAVKKVSRDVMDPSEDSGFESIVSKASLSGIDIY